MTPEVARYRELGRLIRAAQTELAERQSHLTEAHERELNPAELGVNIAQLGYQISLWKCEQEVLFGQIAGEEATESLSAVMRTFFLDRLNEQRRCLKA